MPVWPPLKLLGCLIGHYMCKFCEQNASGLSYCTNSTLWIGKKLAWSRDCLCFAARFLWKKVNTQFIPDAFQTLRFFCSGQDIKAIKAVWNTINQNSFSHPILVSRLLLRIGVAMTVFKVTSDLDRDILDIT